VNEMNIPGFTAEASLYRESEHYRMAGAHTHADGAIQPAGPYRPIGPLIRAALRVLLNPQPLPPQASIRGHYSRAASCDDLSCSISCYLLGGWEGQCNSIGLCDCY
jgi:hypothetical protein